MSVAAHTGRHGPGHPGTPAAEEVTRARRRFPAPAPPLTGDGTADLLAIAEALSTVARRAGGVDGHSPLEELVRATV